MHDRKQSRDERGNGLVEMALVLPIAMCLLLGILTGGQAYFQKISLVDAAREGARYGASLKIPTANTADWKVAVKNRVASLSGGQLTAADVCVDLVKPTGSNTACGVNDPQGAAADPTSIAPASVVKVSVSKATRIDFLFFSKTPTLTSKVAARYERDIL